MSRETFDTDNFGGVTTQGDEISNKVKRGNNPGRFGVSAVFPTSGTQKYLKKMRISYFTGATRFTYYISISFPLKYSD